MHKIKLMAATAAATLALTIGAAAAPAQAYTTGTVGNAVGCFSCGESVYTSNLPRPNGTSRVLPYGTYRSGVASFECVKRCKSKWGYEYPLGVWVNMSTTGRLDLFDA